MNSRDLDSYAAPLIGHQLVSVEKKDYSWFFMFTEGVSVATESPWRLINEGRIVVTSEDDGHQFGLPQPVDAASNVREALRGRTVEAAAICESSGDLIITFSEQAQLQVLQMSGEYESWRLSHVGGETSAAAAVRLHTLREARSPNMPLDLPAGMWGRFERSHSFARRRSTATR